MREINPLTLFMKILPVTYNLTKDCGMVVQRQAIFAVVTVIPAPGVDVWRCFESVCREHPCATVRDERLMLFAKVRMHATDVTKMMVGQRERRIPLDGVNAFVRSAHEFETGNKIIGTLTKRHGKAVSGITIIGLAHSNEAHDMKELKFASEAWIYRAIEWRSKFTDACTKKRQDCANRFPFMPKMPVYRHVGPLGGVRRGSDSDMENDEGTPPPPAQQDRDPRDKYGYIEGVVTLELFQVCEPSQ